MEVDQKVQLINANSRMWQEIRPHMTEMEDFLTDEKITSNTPLLLYNSCQLVLSELVLNHELYSRYLTRDYSDEDFVNMIIASMNNVSPGIDDIEGNTKYMEDIRNVIWGHIKKYQKEFVAILRTFNDDNDRIINGRELLILKECMTVVFVECALREREMTLLQEMYD